MSNKTPANHDAKTASAPKPAKPKNVALRILLGGGLAAVLMVIVYFALVSGGTITSTAISDSCVDDFYDSRSNYNLTIRGKVFNTKLLTDEYSRQLGLSGRQCIPEDSAVEFVFEKPGKYCFWMKDMNFAIDIVWIDEDGVINRIERNVSPDTYPKSFCPEDEGQYVLEFKAGIAKRLELTEGDKVTL